MAYEREEPWEPGQREALAAMVQDEDRQRKWLAGVAAASAMVATGGCESMRLELSAGGEVDLWWVPLDPDDGEYSQDVSRASAELVLAKGADAWLAEELGAMAAFVASVK